LVGKATIQRIAMQNFGAVFDGILKSWPGGAIDFQTCIDNPTCKPACAVQYRGGWELASSDHTNHGRRRTEATAGVYLSGVG
jgi:hypothetical protein